MFEYVIDSFVARAIPCDCQPGMIALQMCLWSNREVWHFVVVDVVGVACFSVLLQTAPSTCELLTGALTVCLK
jgi:hypothetical protein